jgi:uncharacterized membrane protein YdjX (TVP38/TMEM64 family)
MFNFYSYFKKKQGLRRFIGPKRVFLLCLIIFFIAYFRLMYGNINISYSDILDFKNNNPVVMVFVFIIIFSICVPLLIPLLPLNLAGGVLWGGLLGGLYTAVGVTIGSWIGFQLARLIVDKPLEQSFNVKWLNIVSAGLSESGWKFLAFIRINPIIPTSILNYVLGATNTSNYTFLWTTFVFILPPSIAVSMIGDAYDTFSTDTLGVSSALRLLFAVSAVITVFIAIKFFINLLLNNKNKGRK